MDVTISKLILAVVTTEDKPVGGVPTFYAKSEDERARMSTILSRVLEAVAHDMGNGIYIIVKH